MADNFRPNIGDVVRIREYEDLANEYGVNSHGNVPCKFMFCKWMRDICGLEFVIDEITNNGEYLGHDTGYLISLDMLESVSEKGSSLEISSFLESIKITD